MSKLWIFGDSFAEDCRDPQSWTNQLAEKLDCEVVNRALSGVDNVWITHQFQQHVSQIDADDYVITVLTDPQRCWLFENVPNLSNWYSLHGFWEKAGEAVSSQEVKSAKGYVQHLWNSKLAVTLYEMSLYYCSSHPNGKVIQPFFEIPGIRGTLLDVSRMEHKGSTLEEKFSMSLHNSHDPRSNHLSSVNHNILADKMYDWIKNPETLLDLTSGFEENFLTF